MESVSPASGFSPPAMDALKFWIIASVWALSLIHISITLPIVNVLPVPVAPSNTCSFLPACKPVSYTHLDVYKRQTKNCATIFILDTPIESSTPISYSRVFSVKAVTRVMMTTALITTIQTMMLENSDSVSSGRASFLNAVSYTHLDVYKRQPAKR